MNRRIGFVGIGLMGHGAAKNLVEKGFPLAFLAHRNRAPAEDLVKRGARELRSPPELARESEVVILCLPSSREVEAVVLGPGGLVDGASPGLTVIDMTTADPASTLRVGAALAERGIRLVDSPLGRAPADAEAGRLNAMVGADPATLEEVRPVLAAFCENIFHIGPLGSGHRMKLVNNFIGLGTAAVAAEAIVTAAREGLDLALVRDVVAAGGGDSAMFRMLMKWAADGDRTVGRFSLANARKDVRYYARLADAPQTGLMAGAVLQTFNLMNSLGKGDEHLPGLVAALARLNGVKLGPP